MIAPAWPSLQSFVVPGTPVAKGRPRFSRRQGRAFTPTKTARFEQLVALEAQAAGVRPVLEGPVELGVYAFWPMKGSSLKRSERPAVWKVTSPDLDNVVKAVSDALNGVAYRDDGQVVKIVASKIHVSQRGTAHTLVEIRAMRADEAPSDAGAGAG